MRSRPHTISWLIGVLHFCILGRIQGNRRVVNRNDSTVDGTIGDASEAKMIVNSQAGWDP